MDSLFHQRSDLIPTKEAARIFGYHSDYLARLAKQKKIIGTQVGRTWLISRSSLEGFIAGLENRKRAQAHALSAARKKEYHASKPLVEWRPQSERVPATSPLPAATLVIREPKKPQRVTRSPYAHLAHSRLIALTTALVVLGASVAAAQTSFIPREAARVVALVTQTASGFSTIASDSLTHEAMRLATANDTRRASVAAHTLASETAITPLALALSTPRVPQVQLAFAPARTVQQLAEAPRALTASSFDLAAFVMHAPQELAGAYLALGEDIVGMTHQAIALEVSLVYATPEAAQGSARFITLGIGDTGANLADLAGEVPSTTYAFAAQTEQAALALGEGGSRVFFGAEYALATRFLGGEQTLLAADWQATWGAGATLASGAHAAREGALALETGANDLGAARLEDLALGVLGKSALVLDQGAARLAAAATLPALSPLQQVALATYEYFNAIFEPVPRLVVVPPPSPTPAVATSSVISTPSRQTNSSQIAISYPSYTTVVQGASKSYVDQAIAVAENELSGRIAAFIAPVAAQTVVNETSIQQVNMIQSLTGLAVIDGTWNGGLINGASISATTIGANSVDVGTLN
ncbi:MAG: helix-turn-helix domain-containing protein, partial [Minisyncoccia bacterium]